MEINKIHDFINDLFRKELGGYQSPEQIDTALDKGQMRVYNDYLPLYGSSVEAKEALAPFLDKLQYATAADGTYAVPADSKYQSLAGMGIQYVSGSAVVYKPVEFPEEDEMDSRLGSQLLKPSLTDPIGEVKGVGSFLLHPAGVYAGTIRFLRRPKEPKFAYTQAGRVLSYDDTTSVQLEWSDKYQDKVIMASLVYLGLNIGDAEVIQISEALAKLKQ